MTDLHSFVSSTNYTFDCFVRNVGRLIKFVFMEMQLFEFFFRIEDVKQDVVQLCCLLFSN